MTKSELIDRFAKRYPQLVVPDAAAVVQTIFDAIAKRLAHGERIEIRGFGSFGLNYRPSRTGAIPNQAKKCRCRRSMCRTLRWPRNYAIGLKTINCVLAAEYLQSIKDCAFGEPACGYLFTCFDELRFVSRWHFVNVKLS